MEDTPPETPVAPAPEKKRKRRYSRDLEGMQRWGRAASKASRRVARAVAAGLDTWYDRSERSALARRDGALRDSMKNLSKAVSKTVAEASMAPADLLAPLDSKRGRRVARAVARAFVPPFLR
jgi:hypothetical protein